MDSSHKIYRFTKQKIVLALSWACLAFACLPFIGVALDLSSGKEIGVDFVAVIIFWLFAGGSTSFYFFRWAKSAKLIITSNNLICDDIGSSFDESSTTWGNIAGVNVSKIGLFLSLKEPSIPKTKLGEWARKNSVVNPNVINLSNFIDHWNSGELKKDFERYAPHIFQSDE